MQSNDIIFFDLDGTLTDSKEGIFLSLRYALNYFGIQEEDDEKLKLFLGPPLVGAFMQYYQMTEQQANTALEKYREIFAVKGIYALSMYDGVGQMLKNLKKKNKTLCLATAKPILYAKDIVERLKIAQYFDFLEGATMDESRSEKTQVIDHLIKTYGLDKERIIMVGDRDHDIYGAKENGIESLGVLYGYGSREELKKAGCKNFAKTVKEVEKFLSI